MLKKLIDTNIFIDRFANPDLYKDIFLSEGFIYLSAVVLMELRGGTHTPDALKAMNDLADLFKKTVITYSLSFTLSGLLPMILL